MKKKPTIKLEVNNWGDLTPSEKQKAALWAIRLFADLSVLDAVADDFTGTYP